MRHKRKHLPTKAELLYNNLMAKETSRPLLYRIGRQGRDAYLL
jgi:hypothetical protein